VFAPAPPVSLPVEGSALRFPLHRIYCVGRNYADHAIEMGGDPDKEPPFFFQKNIDNVVLADGAFPYPAKTADVHHEIELVVAIGKGGTDIPVASALDHVFGYAVGLDMTRRDLQGEAKKHGRPWEVGKAFEHSAPCGPIHPASRVGHPKAGRIWLTVNGAARQSGDLNQLIWKVPEMVAYLSGYFALRPGDLIMSGTPAGVGPVTRGDVLEGGIDGLGRLTVKVT
jgi:fumarylpyruvate hydrolase